MDEDEIVINENWREKLPKRRRVGHPTTVKGFIQAMREADRAWGMNWDCARHAEKLLEYMNARKMMRTPFYMISKSKLLYETWTESEYLSSDNDYSVDRQEVYVYELRPKIYYIMIVEEGFSEYTGADYPVRRNEYIDRTIYKVIEL